MFDDLNPVDGKVSGAGIKGVGVILNGESLVITSIVPLICIK